MKKNLKYYFLVALTVFAFGCDKDDDKNPSTGTVKGSVSPANGAKSILLVSGNDTLTGTPSSSGTFEIGQVKPGSYQLSVNPNAGFGAPAASAVTVTAGKTTDVPTITLTQLPANGLMSLSLDGTTLSGAPMYTAFGSGLVSLYAGGFQVHMTLPSITGPGTYTSANSDLDFRVLAQSSGAGWETTETGGSATLTVTAFDAATKKGNATFSFVAPANGMGSTGTKTGSNGSLLNVKLK